MPFAGCPLSCFALLSVPLAAACNAQGGLDPTIRAGVTAAVSEHMYVIPDESRPIVPNVGFVVGEKATLVIDTGLGLPNGRIVLAEARKIARTDRFYVAATHTHPEHDLGAMAFPHDAVVVRSSGQQADIDEFGMGLAERFATFSVRTAEALEGAFVRDSDIVFDESMTLDLGGVHVRIMEVGPTHTRGDLAFYVEEDRVLFTGDVVMDQYPMPISPTSSIRRWLAALDEIEALEPELVVPCHYATGSTELIGAYRDYFTAVVTRVGELAREGRTVEEAIETLRAELPEEFGAWTDPNRIGASVRVAYRER